VSQGLKGNELAAQDKKRLKKARRVGPGCVQKCAR
jgi:hypothetical protein